eukprot:scaffold67969_cov31-Tisochrysis_lutea.AAC.1
MPDELYTPLKWGRAYDGPAETAYPIPLEYTVKGTCKTLENININARMLTKYQISFSRNEENKRQKSTIRWEKRIPGLAGKRKQISQLYK